MTEKKHNQHKTEEDSEIVKNNNTVIYIILLVGILALLYFGFTLKENNDYLKNQNLNLNSKVENLTTIVADQKSTIENLESEKSNLISEKTKLESQVNLFDQKISEAKLELSQFEDEVQDSRDWFKENSNIGDYHQYDSLSSQLKKCVRIIDDKCKIKLACLDLIHEKYREFTYSYDNYTSNKTDKLQSLGEFYDNGKGDCEDFSLLMKAEINYLTDYCSVKGEPKYQFEVAQPSLVSTQYFVDFNDEWYYNNAAAFVIPLSYKYTYVVCGNYPAANDPNNIAKTSTFGHCALGMTDIEIKSSSDISRSLTNAIIIEPQSGFLIYDQREKNTLFVPENGDSMLGRSVFVWSVISDQDYYLYNFDESEWRSYSDFLDKIEIIKNEIENLG